MKRILALFFAVILCSTAVFADTDSSKSDGNGDQYDDGKSADFKMNDTGDQFIQISLKGFFPLNFGDKLYVGGAAQLGYHRFLNSLIAVGGDVMVTYNPTLGSNILFTVPITGGIIFQPTIWKFEFPLSLNVGLAMETCQNRKYFPGLVLKADAGMFYRFSESWSFGINTDFLYLPEWYASNPEYNDYGLFLTAALSARYHF